MEIKFIPSAIIVLALSSSPAWAQNDAAAKQSKEIVLDFREAKDATARPVQDKRFASLAEQKALLEARIKAHEASMRHMRKMSKRTQDHMKLEMLEKLDDTKKRNPELPIIREPNDAALLRLEQIGGQMKSALREVEKMIEKEGK